MSIIEIFGDYWHDSSLFPDRLSAEELISYYADRGYKCLVIPELELGNEQEVLRRVDTL